jgi:hypothetical protein
MQALSRRGPAAGEHATSVDATAAATRPVSTPESTQESKPGGTPGTATEAAPRPRLVVVPRRRSWTALVVGTVSAFVFTGLFGAAVFHTQLAERQLRIDRLERAVTFERERFDELRHERAELRSPAHLATVAEELHMITGKTEGFLRVTPEQLAQQIAAAGVANGDAIDVVNRNDALEQFREVKAVSEGQP